MACKSHPGKATVIDLFSKQVLHPGDDQRVVRISPEYDGISMLYSNDTTPGKTFKLQLIGWGLQHNGKVVGLIPWLNSVTSCPALGDPLNGRWEGYINARTGEIFYQAPDYKVAELQAAYNFYCHNHSLYKTTNDSSDKQVVQEIPDQIGTHAVFGDKKNQLFVLAPIFSWQLQKNGRIEGMLINPKKVQQTPVLVGDNALYSVNKHTDFKYYLQYAIANKIKTQDPEVLRAMSALIKF
jgi:hypothetical protein